MESTDLDMDEIFDDNDIDEDIGATGVLPDLPDATQTQNEDEENAEVLARLKDLSKGAAKKVVRKPQPKLDPTRLTGERGIPILPKLFKDVKFKGKGHEAHDLAGLMQQMEHWAHRLFPKMPFDEMIERVEKLGSKKEVQTCIKKIRLDMPILDDDFVGSDKEEDDVIRRGGEETAKGEVRPEDMWDELLREEAEFTATPVQPDSTVEPGTSRIVQLPSPPECNREPVLGTPAAKLQTMTDAPGGFTPEQLERIEKNKQLAQERRLKKMGHLTPGSKMSSEKESKSEIDSSQPQSNTDKIRKEDSHADDEVNSQTVEGNSQTLRSVDEGNSQILTSKGNSQTQKSAEESQSAKKDIDRNNSEGLEEMDTEMSEVLEKGSSQNITVARVPSENAQNWHTGPAEGTDTGLTLGSDISTGVETMEVENNTVADKDGTAEMSEIIGNQDVGKIHSNSSNAYSQEMSEIIEKQDEVKVILKEKPCNLNSDCINEKQTAVTKKLPSAKLDKGDNQDKENTQKNCEDVGKEHEGLETGKLEQTTDNVKGNIEADVDDFDDELTEDQLMESLES